MSTDPSHVAASRPGHSSGPDLVVAGAARSGTTQLAARLSVHPHIDGGAVKEPNYFSREFERGASWYDALYQPRAASLCRLDASVSYTYPQFPEAIGRLHRTSPDAQVVYVVRDPVDRAVSHYLLNRYYFGHEEAEDFGTALRRRSFYLDVSDYAHWLSRLTATFPEEQLLVVPFDVVTSDPQQLSSLLFQRLGLPVLDEPATARVDEHRNSVVTFRSESARRLTRRLRHSAAYPKVRRLLGPSRMKRLRSLVTRVPEMPTVVEALDSCDPGQLAQLHHLADRAREAVSLELGRQDQLLGLTWKTRWKGVGE